MLIRQPRPLEMLCRNMAISSQDVQECHSLHASKETYSSAHKGGLDGTVIVKTRYLIRI
jgi:hypothetical protein